MRIDQVLVGASAGDAITGAALAIRDVLRGAVSSDVFAEHIDPAVADEVRPFAEYDAAADGPVVYHLSIGGTPIADRLARSPRPLVISYHNITPSHFFRTIDPPFADLLDQGRDDLRLLSNRAQAAIADSQFNAEDLHAAGYRDVRTIPPVIPADRLLGLPRHEPLANHLANVVTGPVILYVGQLLPHKRIDLLLQAYHLLVSHHRPDAHLVVVGKKRNPHCWRHLQQQARELNLNRSWFTGSVTDEELAAFYDRADVFATMSEHEGLCFPVVEAMAFGVPVLARSFAALPETVGDAGLLLAESDGCATAAEALGELLENGRLRDQLVANGKLRAESFRSEDVIKAHIAVLLEMV